MKSLNQPVGTAASMAFVAVVIFAMLAYLSACDCCYLGDLPRPDCRADRKATVSGEISAMEPPISFLPPAALFDSQDWWISGLPQTAPHRSAPVPSAVDYFPADFLFSLLQ